MRVLCTLPCILCRYVDRSNKIKGKRNLTGSERETHTAKLGRSVFKGIQNILGESVLLVPSIQSNKLHPGISLAVPTFGPNDDHFRDSLATGVIYSTTTGGKEF